MKYDIITLNGQHSLIMPNLPIDLKMNQLEKKAEMEAKEVSSFGLFDTATPNFSNYYPDVKAEDLNPEADQASFIYPVYRALSEVIVHKKYNPIDFGVNKVLKNAMGMLKAQTVYPNHEMAVGNELGVIYEESWQNAYTTASGVKVPAGINVRLKLDGKSNPKIIRGILMDPPSIHSTSVTVEFGWEKSHNSMEDNEFWGKLGTYGADGQMVRRVATEIKKFHEISLVPHGADPFAQLIKDGKLNNPEYANKVYNSEKSEAAKRYFTFSYKENLTQLSEETPDPIQQQNQNPNNNMKYLVELAQRLGLSTEGKDEVALQLEVNNAISAKLTAAASVEGLQTQITNLTKEVGDLKAEKESLSKDAAIGKTALSEKKEAVKTQLALLKDNNVDATLLSVIENANLEALNALEKDYATQLDAKAPIHCQDCQSTNVSRRTSTATQSNSNKTEGGAKPKTVSEAAKEIELSHTKPAFFLAGEEESK